MPHWAHREMCDPWWEGETEWHRDWKGHFPKEWQEVIHFAENGEKHIADVKTEQDYWRDSAAPVFFDSRDGTLWLLLPKTIEGRYIFRIKRSELISYLLPVSGMRFEALLKSMNTFLLSKETLTSLQSPQQYYTNYSLNQGGHL